MTKKTILIIDDSKVSRMMISALISELDSDLQQVQAENSESALELVKKNEIDFFSVDLNMPGMDGLELISKLKPEYPNAKFSLLTANVQDNTRSQCDALGINYTEKPVTEESIKGMLEYFNE